MTYRSVSDAFTAQHLERIPLVLMLAFMMLASPVCLAEPELEVSTYALWWGFDSLGEPDSNENWHYVTDDTESSFLSSSSSVSGSTYSVGGPGHASVLVGYGYLSGASAMGNPVSSEILPFPVVSRSLRGVSSRMTPWSSPRRA